ncbi:MAG: type II toxin-antitoxin system Phd/YefM family antitoxin [Fibrobacterota bacterium]
MDASVLDLRYKTREVLKALGRNEEVTLFYRGVKKGVIIPVAQTAKRKRSGKIPGVGMWKGMTEPVSEMMARLRKGRPF